MARSTTRSLAGKAASAARKVVTRRSPAAATNGTAGAAKKTAAKTTAPRNAKKAPRSRLREEGSGRQGSGEEGAACQEGPGEEGCSGEEGGRPAKAAPAKKAPAKKAPAKKAPVARAPAKKAPAKKAPQGRGEEDAREEDTGRQGPGQGRGHEGRGHHVPTSEEGSHEQVGPGEEGSPCHAGHQDRHQDRHPRPRRAAKKAPSKRTAAPSSFPVLPGEKPWTKAEIDEVLADLHGDRARVVRTLSAQEEELAGLMRDAGDGAGHDQADMGATSFERDQELTVVNNEREKLAQIDRALARIADGTYGICESCGNPIGKGRAMAFPRATLCLTCKQREERR